MAEPGTDGLVVLTENGGCEVVFAGLCVEVVVEAERGPGQFDPAGGGVLDLDEKSLGRVCAQL